MPDFLHEARGLFEYSRSLRRRGACAHIDGAAQAMASALRFFRREFQEHACRGPCPACSRLL